jgi:hypothetical protein
MPFFICAFCLALFDFLFVPVCLFALFARSFCLFLLSVLFARQLKQTAMK